MIFEYFLNPSYRDLDKSSQRGEKQVTHPPFDLFQLALLLHGTDEPVDWTQVTSEHNSDNGKRMGKANH